MMGCGIPEVTIEGPIDDQGKRLKRLDFLVTYNLKWWTNQLKPIILKIIKTKSGAEFDKNFG